MRLTRSSAAAISAGTTTRIVSPSQGKRKANTEDLPSPASSKSKKPRGTPTLTPTSNHSQPDLQTHASEAHNSVPAVLKFSFDDAKNHLIGADSRFQDIFARLSCRPFEQLERMDPFWTLVSSIIGQQISWLAARSITHKFIRLYDPTLPQKLEVEDGAVKTKYTSFPSAQQVSTTDIATLKLAGLSTRKAEYVQDLATRFADGRLSTAKIMQANDTELAEMLIAVRGIGQWTVDMFAIFSLRRPDILPVGDLGVQRGLLRWFLSLHSPSHTFSLSPKKLPKSSSDSPGQVARTRTDEPQVLEESSRASLPLSGGTLAPATLPSTPKKGSRRQSNPETGLTAPPAPFTPSINRTLHTTGTKKSPLPDGLTVATLKSRLDGKKKIKGALLTPTEMEELTQAWRPYRSLGVYYMWALAEEQ